MSDSYLPDNAPRDILLSLEELAARKLPHAPTFRKAAAEIERLRQLLSDTNTYYAECIAEREELRAENEKLRKALDKQAEKHIRLIELMQEKETLHDPYEDGINAGLRFAVNIIKESVEKNDD